MPHSTEKYREREAEEWLRMGCKVKGQQSKGRKAEEEKGNPECTQKEEQIKENDHK